MEYQTKPTTLPLQFRTAQRQLVAVRQATAADAVLAAEFLCRLSDQARHMRYMRSGRFSAEAIWQEAARMTRAQSADHLTLLATIQPADDEELIAEAELAPDSDDPTMAEIALVVRDDMQRQGLGSFLLWRLIRTAQRSGITHVSASMLAENRAMLGMINRLGLPYTSRTRSAEIHTIISLPGSRSDIALAQSARRLAV